jgi:hypothetical protein
MRAVKSGSSMTSLVAACRNTSFFSSVRDDGANGDNSLRRNRRALCLRYGEQQHPRSKEKQKRKAV